MQRSTIQVLEDHLRLRQAGQLDTDLEQNYASDVILLCDRGTFKGREAVRKSGEDLTAQLPDGRFEYVVKYVTGEYAYLRWTADSATNRIEDGADTFVIRNGRIIMQSIFYRLKPRC
jgi:SnoaL-like domain